MKKSLLALCLMMGVTQSNAAERVVIDIFMPLTVCIPKLKLDTPLKRCEH